LVLGYAADLPWLTVGTRLRGTTASLRSIDGGLLSRHYELGLSVVLQRYVDLPWFSLAFGVAIEGIWIGQRFATSPRQVDPRNTLGMGFSALFAIERQLAYGIGVRFEGGPLASLDRQAATMSGEAQTAQTRSMFTWWLGGGTTWRF
jgi:hypothetical protein